MRVERRPVIFLGEFVQERVEEAVGNPSRKLIRVYRVRVLERLRGLTENDTEVDIYWHPLAIYGAEQGPVGVYPTRMQGQHIFYLGDATDGGFHSGTCGFAWSKVDQSRDELEFVRSYLSGDTKTAIYGRVQAHPRTLVTTAFGAAVMGAKVTAQGVESTHVAVADASGRYRIEGMPAGEYLLGVELEHWAQQGKKKTIEVNTGGCAVANLSLQAQNFISGSVYGPDGNRAAGIPVTLVEVGREGDSAGGARTDREGRYRIEHIHPGDYLVGVSPRGASAKTPYSPSFFVDGSDFASALPLRIEAGTQRSSVDLQIGPRIATRHATASVHWPDGTRADAYVRCVELAADGTAVVPRRSLFGISQKDGTQKFDLLVDRPYRIAVSRRGANTRGKALFVNPQVDLVEERTAFVPPGSGDLEFRLVLSEADAEKHRLEP